MAGIAKLVDLALTGELVRERIEGLSPINRERVVHVEAHPVYGREVEVSVTIDPPKIDITDIAVEAAKPVGAIKIEMRNGHGTPVLFATSLRVLGGDAARCARQGQRPPKGGPKSAFRQHFSPYRCVIRSCEASKTLALDLR